VAQNVVAKGKEVQQAAAGQRVPPPDTGPEPQALPPVEPAEAPRETVVPLTRKSGRSGRSLAAVGGSGTAASGRRAAAPTPRQQSRAARPAKAAPARVASQTPAVTEPEALPAAAEPARPQRGTAGPGRMRRRHWGVALTFLLCVALPLGVAAWYLWTRAADQYASTVGFAVRREDISSSMEILGGLTALSGATSSSDTDILYEFIQSQDLVARIDEAIDLRGMWSKPADDPVFAYAAPGTIEDLVDQWQRMVRVYYDSGTGLIEVRALAFDPDDAQAITTEILDRSTRMINDLNDVAREDSLRYAREELELSVEKLKAARQAMTAFRNRTQIVDPAADVQSQMGLLGTLQTQMADALINLDILMATTRPGDPRIEQAELRIRVIEDRIRDERQKLGLGAESGEDQAFATLVGEYERLVVDLQFAEGAYTAALASYDGAQAETRRTSRYLAAHIAPTRAETARFPRRTLLLSLTGLFLFMSWAIGVLVYYSVKDRR
jgi:capsular polysaccharide transport system permease protein